MKEGGKGDNMTLCGTFPENTTFLNNMNSFESCRTTL